jgi:predicted GTPase
MGAAGRDFHNFNVFYRDNPDYQVVAFTATQIPNIEGRLYPPELAGKLYPNGIPIHPESELTKLVKDNKVEQVVFAYSDVFHQDVMHKASIALAAGEDFTMLGAATHSGAIHQTRGCHLRCAHRLRKKSNHRRVSKILTGMGFKVAAIRHHHALWRSGETSSATLLKLCRSG